MTSVSALLAQPQLRGAGDVLITPLCCLPPADSGVYLSRRTLTPQDSATLLHLLRLAARSPLWKWYQHYYPPNMSAYAVRPR